MIVADRSATDAQRPFQVHYMGGIVDALHTMSHPEGKGVDKLRQVMMEVEDGASGHSGQANCLMEGKPSSQRRAGKPWVGVVVGGKSKKIIIHALRGDGWMGVHVQWNDSKLRVRAGVQGWFEVRGLKHKKRQRGPFEDGGARTHKWGRRRLNGIEPKEHRVQTADGCRSRALGKCGADGDGLRKKHAGSRAAFRNTSKLRVRVGKGSIRDGQAATTRPGRSEDYHLHCARATTQCANWCGCSRGRTERHTYIMVASCKWMWADVTPLRLELEKIARRRVKSQLGDPVRLYTGSASTAKTQQHVGMRGGGKRDIVIDEACTLLKDGNGPIRRFSRNMRRGYGQNGKSEGSKPDMRRLISVVFMFPGGRANVLHEILARPQALKGPRPKKDVLPRVEGLIVWAVVEQQRPSEQTERSIAVATLLAFCLVNWVI
ncbi:hypothetical protein B0H14DRAFT_2567008 [Mycena olivaceomarginata]|nr:hypothetical protein B0H14DRAFT_2567008 [Mycena olivaceomarginata]